MENKTQRVSEIKSIALVAHDKKKEELVDWAYRFREGLMGHQLYATGTTGAILEKRIQLPVCKLVSGPLGGDQQIGAMITENKLDLLVFFLDPMQSQPHDPDIKALLRIAAVWNIPFACNQSTAEFVISSPLMSRDHDRVVPDYEQYLLTRPIE
ncbi:methylglyoxal synthase [Endozoicomonas arenosclerae]|uniref:methylglyoxal synthase n=1 Tax=Endozoicomonas arenosclerae TaxID=1633495 RepID=UPI00078076C8|nr:methylglyoxal synthase [Endozoicomonas arenosclerae]